MTPVDVNVLSQKVRAEIDRWIVKFPPERKQSALLPALLIAQEDHDGWLTNEIIEAVADYINIPKIAAYEVVTFYSMYDLKPVGKTKILLCTNISCMLSGSEILVQFFRQRYGIGLGETTPDGKFTLKEAECLAACAGAPACIVGKKYYENVTPEKMENILMQLEESGDA